MSKVLRLIALCTAGIFLFSGTPYAEVVDVTVPITIGATIGAVASLTVTPVTIATGLNAAGISFTSPGAATWTVANEYLRVVYNCNYPLWAVRIVTNNVAAFPGMAAKPVDLNGDGVVDGDSYSGLIDAATQDNPENRANLTWQVYVDPTGAGALDDATVGGTWNSNWAYVADVSNTGYDPEVDSDNNVNTLAYPTIIQGGGASSGLAFHPALDADGDGNTDAKPGDGNVAVYLGARFGGLSQGSYSANLTVQLIHE